MIDIRAFRKEIKEGKTQILMLGNMLYLHDAETDTDYRIGPAKTRHPDYVPHVDRDKLVPICPVCGEKIRIKERANYCSYCGTKFDWIEGNNDV